MKPLVLLFTLFFIIILFQFGSSEPGFNGTAPGCSGSSCHGFQAGIVITEVLPNNQVRVTVSGNTGNVAGELVNSLGVVVAVQTAGSTNPFVLTAPGPGSYVINAGYKSPSRVYGTATALLLSAPPAPDSLTVNATSNSQITLMWKDNSADEEGFKIERKTGSAGTFSEIAQVNANIKTYSNTGLTAGTEYCYRVRSFNAAGNSGYSNEVCASTYPNAPAAPSNLTAEVVQSPLSVTLNWTDNSLTESGFQVEREVSANVFEVIDSVASNVNTFQDLNVSVTTYRYRVKAFNVTGSSAYSNIAEIFVPVELNSFTAENSDGKVLLKWSTATETQNRGFEVERKYAEGEFVSIRFIEGKGTTTERSDYSFMDSKVNAGKYIYRLKQIDFNGAFSYSEEAETEVAAPEAFSLSQNYPNPFNPATSISFSLPAAGYVSLKIFDVIGNEVAVIQNGEMETGIHTISFDASNLTSGVYLYQIKVNNFISTRKMILMK